MWKEEKSPRIQLKVEIEIGRWKKRERTENEECDWSGNTSESKDDSIW